MRTLFISLLLAISGVAQLQAQSESSFPIKYMVTYEAARKLYTAWVVPGYSVPNVNNGDTEEKGVTAQVTLRVPADFNLTSVLDLKGTWDKQPTKLGSQAAFRRAGANALYGYYVISKTPAETSYGAFVTGEPVALFTFQGQGGTPEGISVVDQADPFVKLADQALALNVGSSFYSRSGQATRMTAKPLEQFDAQTTMTTVLADLVKKLGVDAQLNSSPEPTADELLVAYPNPVVETLAVKYFSQQDNAVVRLQVIDVQGSIKQSSQQTVKLGFNTLQVNMTNTTAGTYLLQTLVGDKVITRKILKQL